MGEKAAGTLKLSVILDTSSISDPHVIIIQRAADAGGGKIRWKRNSESVKFKFTAFEPKSTPFENVVVKNKSIKCDFNPSAGDPAGTEYPYTITVEYDGTSYVSDKAIVVGPAEGRAVIRN